MDEAAREEAELEEAPRQRAEEIRASEEVATRAAASDTGPFADAAMPQIHRASRQQDRADTAAYQQSNLGRRRGPRR